MKVFGFSDFLHIYHKAVVSAKKRDFFIFFSEATVRPFLFSSAMQVQKEAERQMKDLLSLKVFLPILEANKEGK